MGEFDREELKAAFEAGKIPVSDDNIRRLDDLLRSLAQQYRARKVAREQDLNGQLTRLEATKNSLEGLWDTETLLYAFEVETPQIISRLLGAVEYGIDFLKNEKKQRKVMIPRLHFLWVCAMSMSSLAERRASATMDHFTGLQMHSTAPFSSHRPRSARVPAPGWSRVSSSECLSQSVFIA
jgi:hypothetical protein